MIFDEIYSLYYGAVNEILNTLAHDKTISVQQIISIAENKGIQHITDITEPLVFQEWNLATPINPNNPTTSFTPVIEQKITIPLSLIQKRWLKAISLDPRFQLFDVNIEGLENIEPLFYPDDCIIFDKNNDGDDYNDPEYQQKFRFCLKAIREKTPVVLGRIKRNGGISYIICQPTDMEYSEKDDKFRLRVNGSQYVNIINLSSIFSYELFQGEFFNQECQISNKKQQVTLLITDTHKTLERCMLHFAHFRTSVQKTENPNQYKVVIEYDEEDVSEMVIRVLRFGPYAEVLEPADFRTRICEKLKAQYRWNS